MKKAGVSLACMFAVMAAVCAHACARTGNEAPTVQVISPNGGERLPGGLTIPITWSADHPNGVIYCNIYHSLDNGNKWKTLAVNADNNGSWEWTAPPHRISDSCLVKVIAISTEGVSGSDQSDSVFTIHDTIPPQVMVITPNDGQTVAAGRIARIHWVASDNTGIDSVAIYLQEGATGPWEPLHKEKGNPKTWYWSVPDREAFPCHIRVRTVDAAGNSASDETDEPFRITRKKGFISPDSLWVPAGSGFEYLVRYVAPGGRFPFLTFRHPDWVDTKRDTVTGIAPDSGCVDTVVAILTAGDFSDTLKLKIHVGKGIGITSEESREAAGRFCVDAVRLNGGFLEIQAALFEEGDLDFHLCNIAGQTVWRSWRPGIGPGQHRFRVAGSKVAAGVYLLQLRHAGKVVQRKIFFGH